MARTQRHPVRLVWTRAQEGQWYLTDGLRMVVQPHHKKVFTLSKPVLSGFVQPMVLWPDQALAYIRYVADHLRKPCTLQVYYIDNPTLSVFALHILEAPSERHGSAPWWGKGFMLQATQRSCYQKAMYDCFGTGPGPSDPPKPRLVWSTDDPMMANWGLYGKWHGASVLNVQDTGTPGWSPLLTRKHAQEAIQRIVDLRVRADLPFLVLYWVENEPDAIRLCCLWAHQQPPQSKYTAPAWATRFRTKRKHTGRRGDRPQKAPQMPRQAYLALMRRSFSPVLGAFGVHHAEATRFAWKSTNPHLQRCCGFGSPS